MPQIKPLLQVICFFLFMTGFASCSPRVLFDFRTSRPAEVFPKASPAEHPVPLLAFAPANGPAAPEGEEQEALSYDLPPNLNLPVNPQKKDIEKVISRTALTPSALVSADKKEIFLSRQAWKESTRSVLKGKKKERAQPSSKNIFTTLSSLSKNPFNQGILAAFLILGLGTALIVLGALLPSLGSILAWVLGVMVLLVGIAFLALTLMGFSVRIIG